MILRRVSVLSILGCALAGPFLAGCNTAPQRITAAAHTDDFGSEVAGNEDVTIETVQRNQLMHQRAQVEVRLGPSFPFDLFDPGRDARDDNDPAEFFNTFEGWAIGVKGALEAYKNVFWGVAFDYSNQNIAELSLGVDEQINAVDSYDRFTFLGTFDYDIPLSESADALVIRLGLGVGIVVFKFEDDGLAEIEDIYQIVFRPAVGLRYPIHENAVVFTELSYDIVPDKSLGTSESQGISGERAVLSSGAIWVGVAFQW